MTKLDNITWLLALEHIMEGGKVKPKSWLNINDSYFAYSQLQHQIVEYCSGDIFKGVWNLDDFRKFICFVKVYEAQKESSLPWYGEEMLKRELELFAAENDYHTQRREWYRHFIVMIKRLINQKD